ncbi:hypothetical protein ACLOJK_033330 [Asimina triloba]
MDDPRVYAADPRGHTGAGIISKIYLENFMCHSSLEIKFDDYVNFVTGQNGSGKSAILTALCVAFGCRARGTQRATSLKDFIKTGCSDLLDAKFEGDPGKNDFVSKLGVYKGAAVLGKAAWHDDMDDARISRLVHMALLVGKASVHVTSSWATREAEDRTRVPYAMSQCGSDFEHQGLVFEARLEALGRCLSLNQYDFAASLVPYRFNSCGPLPRDETGSNLGSGKLAGKKSIKVVNNLPDSKNFVEVSEAMLAQKGQKAAFRILTNFFERRNLKCFRSRERFFSRCRAEKINNSTQPTAYGGPGGGTFAKGTVPEKYVLTKEEVAKLEVCKRGRVGMLSKQILVLSKEAELEASEEPTKKKKHRLMKVGEKGEEMLTKFWRSLKGLTRSKWRSEAKTSLVEIKIVIVEDLLQKIPKGVRGNELVEEATAVLGEIDDGSETKMRVSEVKAEARRMEAAGATRADEPKKTSRAERTVAPATKANRGWTLVEGMESTIQRAFDVEARALMLLKDPLPVQLRAIQESAEMRFESRLNDEGRDMTELMLWDFHLEIRRDLMDLEGSRCVSGVELTTSKLFKNIFRRWVENKIDNFELRFHRLGEALSMALQACCGNYALVSVEMKNKGDDAFKAEVYGDLIRIERRILESSSTTTLKDHKGKKVSHRKDELREIVEHFNIDVENPCVIMSQDKSREFLHSGNDKEKFKFFYKATLLQQVNELLQNIRGQLDAANAIVDELESSIRPIIKELNELQAKIRNIEHVEEISQRLQQLKKKLAWSWVYEVHQQMLQQGEMLQKLKDRIPTCQARINGQQVKVERLEGELLEKKKQVALLSDKWTEMKRMKEKFQNNLSLAIKERLELEEDCNRRMNAIRKMRGRVKQLEQQIHDIQVQHMQSSQVSNVAQSERRKSRKRNDSLKEMKKDGMKKFR